MRNSGNTGLAPEKMLMAAVYSLVGAGIFFAVPAVRAESVGKGPMEIKSSEFGQNRMIPDKFSCRGINVNPRILIDHVPAGAKTLALIVDDPDAPVGVWSHWIVFDMPVVSEIRENTVPGKLGTNSFGVTPYRGPCPPTGTHRYFFKLYALDSALGLTEGVSREKLEKAMEGHILAKAELVGLFKKS